MSFLVLCLSDVNANPNKRARQPALLGDHPPEYGKDLSSQDTTNIGAGLVHTEAGINSFFNVTKCDLLSTVVA